MLVIMLMNKFLWHYQKQILSKILASFTDKTEQIHRVTKCFGFGLGFFGGGGAGEGRAMSLIRRKPFWNPYSVCSISIAKCNLKLQWFGHVYWNVCMNGLLPHLQQMTGRAVYTDSCVIVKQILKQAFSSFLY